MKYVELVALGKVEFPYNVVFTSDCSLYCTNGDVRLAGGLTRLDGRVELCVNNSWGGVCGSGWDDSDAAVVCRQIGFSGIGRHCSTKGSTHTA